MLIYLAADIVLMLRTTLNTKLLIGLFLSVILLKGFHICRCPCRMRWAGRILMFNNISQYGLLKSTQDGL